LVKVPPTNAAAAIAVSAGMIGKDAIDVVIGGDSRATVTFGERQFQSFRCICHGEPRRVSNSHVICDDALPWLAAGQWVAPLRQGRIAVSAGLGDS